MAARQVMKEKLQRTSKYGHLRISQDICHVRMTDIEGFLTIYGHSNNLLNNNFKTIILRGRAGYRVIDYNQRGAARSADFEITRPITP